MELIDNKYRILRTLGKGGCGTVYVCWSDALDREVAVKVLHDQLHSNVNLARFRNEAQSLSLCKHPCIVQCLNFGISDEGYPYFVMDFVPGVSLSEELKQNGPLSPPRFLNLFKNVLSALECAHEAGLVHRDLKPSNILIANSGASERAVLIDFGLTKQLDGQKLTATSSLLGTPQYMSPEQCQGGEVDIRSDLYSIGCTMYEAATGQALYQGDAMQILLAHAHAKPTGIPTVLTPLLNRLLEKERTKRFSTAGEAAASLDGLNLSTLTKFETVTQAPRKRPIGIAASPRALLALAAVLCLLSFMATRLVRSSADVEAQAVKFQQAIQQKDYQTSQALEANYIKETYPSIDKVKSILSMARLQVAQNDNQAALVSCNEARAELQTLNTGLRQLELDAGALKLAIQVSLGKNTEENKPLVEELIQLARTCDSTGISELNFLLEHSRSLILAKRLREAEQSYERASSLALQKGGSDYAKQAKVLLEHTLCQVLCGETGEKMCNQAEKTCQLFELASKTRKEHLAEEFQVNQILTANSKIPAQLKAASERLQRIAQDENLTGPQRTNALYKAGCASADAGDKATALPLMRQAKNSAQREGPPPYAAANLIIATTLNKYVVSDLDQRVRWSREFYKNLQPFRHTQSDQFAVSANQLGVALRASGHEQEAESYLLEAGVSALEAANFFRLHKNPVGEETFNQVNISAEVQFWSCCLVTGHYAAAKESSLRCHKMMKRLSPSGAQQFAKTVADLDKELLRKSAAVTQ